MISTCGKWCDFEPLAEFDHFNMKLSDMKLRKGRSASVTCAGSATAILGKIVASLLVAWSGACSSGSDPERALEAYVRAVSENRCEDARKLLSERTNYALDSLRVKPQHPQNPLGIEEYYCNRLIFEDCKSGKMTLSDQSTDTATVSMPCGRTQDSILPGFSSPFLKYEPRATEMVREKGEWHVVAPMVIRIVEIRESEDRRRDAAIREHERLKRKHESTAR